MLGISFPQFLIIIAIGVVVIGPKRMPEIARVVGRVIAEIRNQVWDLRAELKESKELDEIRNLRDELRQQIFEADRANRKGKENDMTNG